jgi:hypothetical protein
MLDINHFLSVIALVDIAIALTLVEGVALYAYHRFTGRGVAPRDFALNLFSGLCLMLALRFALSGIGWIGIATCLSAAGLAHAADIVRRWKRSRRLF